MFPEAAAAAREYFVSAGDGEFADTLGAGLDEKQYRAGMKRTADTMVAGAGRRHIPAIRIARMFAHAADHGSALDWLERAMRTTNQPCRARRPIGRSARRAASVAPLRRMKLLQLITRMIVTF
jgi:hypothetical protein